MKLQELVPSYQTCRYLRGQGWIPGACTFVWYKVRDTAITGGILKVASAHTPGNTESVDAPLFEELMQLAPVGTEFGKFVVKDILADTQYSVWYTPDAGEVLAVHNDNLTEALALLLIKLHVHNIINISDAYATCFKPILHSNGDYSQTMEGPRLGF